MFNPGQKRWQNTCTAKACFQNLKERSRTRGPGGGPAGQHPCARVAQTSVRPSLRGAGRSADVECDSNGIRARLWWEEQPRSYPAAIQLPPTRNARHYGNHRQRHKVESLWQRLKRCLRIDIPYGECDMYH